MLHRRLAALMLAALPALATCGTTPRGAPARPAQSAGGPATTTDPAVIAGHVDSHTGPAAFYRLRDLRPGDLVRVVRADRRVVRFVVESLARIPKPALPADQVYGPTTAPALRLITCAGTFDHRRRSYRDNLLVSAAIAAGPQARADR
jgi:hypothetical protein